MSVTVKLNGAGKLGSKARIITLTNPNPDAENPVGGPATVVPQEGELAGVAPVIHLQRGSLIFIDDAADSAKLKRYDIRIMVIILRKLVVVSGLQCQILERRQSE